MIGAKLNELLRQHKMTRKALADKLGVTPSAVSSWVYDTRVPLFTHMQQISAIFGVSLSYFDSAAPEQPADKVGA